jgi:hypothetical protein
MSRRVTTGRRGTAGSYRPTHCPIPLPRPRGRTGAIERYWNQPKASFEAQKKFPTCFCSGSEINVSVFIETSCRLNSI